MSSPDLLASCSLTTSKVPQTSAVDLMATLKANVDATKTKRSVA
jgi:hypothetical protein